MRKPSYTKKILNDDITTKFFHGNLHLDNRSYYSILGLNCFLANRNLPFEIVHVYPHGAVEVKDKTGFIFKAHYDPDAPFMGYSEAISSVMEKYGWQIFCLHLDDVLTRVVKEFYAHLISPLLIMVLYMYAMSW
ncbi:hypothetical protein EPI10_006629 [Gossypium australe]|uniref:Uncharacterized protein n=1 Tax=Gossypium australe TaxID=47621 RepID=A0A5B6WSW6_9ROSI|nr:hypothetical protein EPI10_006629 [Gossypium australe]